MKEPSISVPYLRPRRLRDNAILREAIAETAVRPEHLMLPMFVSDIKTDNPIASMPGVSQRSIPSLVREIGSLVERGLRSFILFGVPKTKDALAFLTAVKAIDDLTRVPDSRHIRAGRGKRRNRRYVQRRGLQSAYRVRRIAGKHPSSSAK